MIANLAVVSHTYNTRNFGLVPTKRDGFSRMNQKDFGLKSGLKGQSLKRAFAEYCIEVGKQLNAAISSEIASGNVIAERIDPTKNGYSVKFRNPATLVLNPAKNKTQEIAEKLVAKGIFPTIEAAKQAIA